MIAEHAEQAERDRKQVDAVIGALEQSGVFKSFVPRRFGGFDLGPDALIAVGIAVGIAVSRACTSTACTSTGWVTTLYMEHNWMLAQFPKETQLEVFGRKPYILTLQYLSYGLC